MQVDIFHGNNVRTEVVGDKLTFALTDVCNILGDANPSNVAKRVRESSLHIVEVDTGYGVKPMNFVDERGLIRVLQTSRSPLVEEFQDWADERIEQLLSGKTVNAGGVVVGNFQVPATFSEALRAYANEVEAHEATKTQLAVAAPKANSFDVFMDSDRLMHISFVAKKFKELGLHIGKEGLGGWLLSRGYIYDDNRSNPFKLKKKLRARTNWVRAGLIVELENSTDSYTSYQIRITPKGLFYFFDAICEEQGITPVPHQTVAEYIVEPEVEQVAA